MTVEEYLSLLPNDRKFAIEEIREMILELYPDIVEDTTYRMPTYTLKGEILCAIASQKNYLALYIMPHDLLEHFKTELKPFNCGKSCIRFKKLEPGTLELFRDILAYTGENYSKSQFFGKMTHGKK